jgi:hypothetical protein
MTRSSIAEAAPLRLIGAILVLAIAGMHAAAASDQAQTALYVGILFGLNAATGVLLAVGLGRWPRLAWPLTAMFAAVTLILYVVARTTGLPADKETDWIDAPFGLPSVIVETTLILVYASLAVTALVSRGGSAPKPRQPWSSASQRRLPHGIH